ncbi:M4 family metallopeptidase [Marinagarivorans algicola]|uniref:M4 family metallopeptidase n=1 Tax=Marinagarivorans algicola TaxID=1513270 RepID=UPI0006B5B14D|nr:M4 family metallopeptidase [Marinagarivorans algicola]
MLKVNTIAAAISLILAGQSYASFAQGINVTDKQMDDEGQVTFIAGELGSVNTGKTVAAVKKIITNEASYAANGNENFSIKRQWVDELGKQHTHLTQTINGIKVYGTSLIAHANTAAPASGGATSLSSNSTANAVTGNAQLYALSGTLAVVEPSASSGAILQGFSSTQSDVSVVDLAEAMGEVASSPELAYVYLPFSQETKLSWKIDVKYQGDNGFEHDSVFFDYESLEEIARHAKVHPIKQYNTYTHNNRPYNDSSRRSLVCSTGKSCGTNAAAQRAHDGASIVYDYFKNKHGRNGINGRDLVMNSNVNVGDNWNNAVWYNNQMFYGEGDGRQFTDFTLSFDIIGHELTHGITEYTANLIYQNASGALNEAMSDILGASADAYKRNSSQPIWKIGAGSYTPGIAGDGLRYMNNPTQDGYSTDYYPERIPFVSNPNSSNDQGGVHGNSGIANLAYVLLVDGGKHPRKKTNVTVPGIGLAKAEKIFYRALTTYFTQSTSFAAARTGTARAAQDLYGAAEKTAVETAWCAVGVGSCPTGNTGPTGPSGPLETISGQLNNVSVAANAWGRYTQVIPAGYKTLTVSTSGGSGDLDLYVRFGAQSSTTSYDCRPYKNGNNETCTINSPRAGTWHIDLRGYSSASGVTLSLEAKP